VEWAQGQQAIPRRYFADLHSQIIRSRNSDEQLKVRRCLAPTTCFQAPSWSARSAIDETSRSGWQLDRFLRPWQRWKHPENADHGRHSHAIDLFGWDTHKSHLVAKWKGDRIYIMGGWQWQSVDHRCRWRQAKTVGKH
jgi:hypothetical protein